MRLCTVIAVLFLTLSATAGEPGKASGNGHIKASFGSSCDELLIEQIGKAEREILVAIYSFTNQRLARTFAKAHKSGVSVTVKYDKGQADWIGMKEALKILKGAGIKCEAIKMSEEHAGMHHKFTVIDGKRVLTGSFNYTSMADRNNYENLVLISSEAIATAYKKEFEGIKSR
jgi:phosphatidylserine/phosphatidylglycerophosphate/cardiolipin synthase-like enzyme